MKHPWIIPATCAAAFLGYSVFLAVIGNHDGGATATALVAVGFAGCAAIIAAP